MTNLFITLHARILAAKRLIAILLLLAVLAFFAASMAIPAGITEAGPATSDTYCSGC